MSLAYRQGVALSDMEFVQYHPTGLPGSGILITEGCRGEGGILTNKDGYRYLQDYELGPETPLGQPKNKYMELGPRDRLSQAFWHEEQKDQVLTTRHGTAVNLDLRHLGEKKINERLPFIRELAKAYAGVDPVSTPVPVRPAVHYTMGGIRTDINTETSLKGLFAVGECACIGLHGANRLGSNSLAELGVFGKVAGEHAAERAAGSDFCNIEKLNERIQANETRWHDLRKAQGSENMADLRKELADTMEVGVGIYRSQRLIEQAQEKISELHERYAQIKLIDRSLVFNTEWLYAIELGFLLDIGEAMIACAAARKESRGSHQRLDEYDQRDDRHYLKHSLIYRNDSGSPIIEYQDVVITKSQPAQRAYGAAAGST